MKNLYKVLFLFLVILFNYNAKASHCVGADLYYDCLGANKFRIYLAFYMDCAGATSNPGGCTYTILTSCAPSSWSSSCNAPGTISLQYRSAIGNACGQVNITSSPIITDITPVCVTSKSNCNGGATQGVEQWLYSYDLTLPSAQTDWIITYSSFARNAGITTIRTPGSVGINVECVIDNKTVACNNSPRFKNLPVPWVCVNNDFCYNNGAVEPDGIDSLSFALVKPQVDITGKTVSYVPGYSEFQPVKSSPPVSLSSVTGDICMHPTMQDISVFALKVTEYRKIAGVYKVIGSVTRDMQIRVYNGCNNKPPAIAGPIVQDICAGKQTCFDITGSDPDVGNKLTMSWNSGIPGATMVFTGNGTGTPVGHFCWAPTAAQINSLPYNFTVNIIDDGCVYNLQQAKSFALKVIDCTALSGDINDLQIIATSQADKIAFVAKKSESLKLQQLNLYKLKGQKFIATSTMFFNEQNQVSFNDLYPEPGINSYKIEALDPESTHAYPAKYFNVMHNKGMPENELLSLYPNPIDGAEAINLESNSDGPFTIALYDAQLKLVFEQQINIQRGKNVIQLEKYNLTKGLYIIKAQHFLTNKTYSFKFVR